MANGFVARWERWYLRDIYSAENKTTWLILFLCLLPLAVLLVRFISGIYPAELTITTRHELAYVPTNYVVVDRVTNVLFENRRLGGAGGVGLPQVEMSVAKFRENTRSDKQYLALRKSSEGIASSGTLEYWDIQDSRALFAKEEIGSPWYRHWGIAVGFWGINSAEIAKNELIIHRSYRVNDDLIGLGLVSLMMSFLLLPGLWILIYLLVGKYTYYLRGRWLNRR